MMIKMGKAFFCHVIMLLCLALCSQGLAELGYGFTVSRVRVRKAPSTSAEILDNLIPERCVIIESEATEGNIHFIGVIYRDSTGDLSTGWVAQSEGNRVYVDEISTAQFTGEFGLPAGTLPDDIAGTSGGHYTVDLTGTQTAKSETTKNEQIVQQETEQIQKETEQIQNETDTVSKTDQASVIRYCQQALQDLGYYSGEITGNIGRKTRNAIRAFQQDSGITGTGELDETTVYLIRLAMDPSSVPSTPEPTASPVPVQTEEAKTSEQNKTETLSVDSTGDVVYQIQTKLKKLGYYTGSLTGHYGEKTANAVRLFQRANGLAQTGVADEQTISWILYGKQAETTGTTSDSESSSESTESGTVYRKGDRSDVISEMQMLLTALKLYSGDVTGHFGSKTKDAVQTFQKKNGLTVTGELDERTVSAIRNAAGSQNTVSEQNTSQTVSSGGIYTLDWFTAKNNGVFSHLGLVRGNYATLKDLNTGKTLRVYIQSAGYHLDVEPATASDTSTFCAIYGVSSASSITYVRRPALLTTSQGYKIVCSIYGQPHGQQVITNNNYNGQFCLHFLNSKTSGSGKVDSDHQSAIQKAISLTGGSAKKIQSTSDL